MENNENSTVETVDTQEEVKTTYTAEEVAQLIQSETDKRVTAALKTQQKKFDKQLSLSRLDDNERAMAEKDDKIAELQELLAQRDMERNKSELKSVLGSRGLSPEFADIVVISEDIQASQANIDKLDKLFKAAVKAEVEKRLAGTAPRGNATVTNELTTEQFRKLTMAEQNALYLSNPELYKRLTNR